MNTNKINTAADIFNSRHAALGRVGKSFKYDGLLRDLAAGKNIPEFVVGTTVGGFADQLDGETRAFILIVTKAGTALLNSTASETGIEYLVDDEWSNNASHKLAGLDNHGITDEPEVMKYFFDIADSYNEEIIPVEASPGSGAEAFNRVFYRAPRIRYHEEWSNGTGYYNGIVKGEHAPKLADGQVVAAQSPLPNDRRILIVGTPLGNVAVFDRYTGGQNGVLVKNTSSRFMQNFGQFVASGAQQAEHIEFLFGNPAEFDKVNVGIWMGRLLRAAKLFKQEGDFAE